MAHNEVRDNLPVTAVVRTIMSDSIYHKEMRQLLAGGR